MLFVSFHAHCSALVHHIHQVRYLTQYSRWFELQFYHGRVSSIDPKTRGPKRRRADSIPAIVWPYFVGTINGSMVSGTSNKTVSGA